MIARCIIRRMFIASLLLAMVSCTQEVAGQDAASQEVASQDAASQNAASQNAASQESGSQPASKTTVGMPANIVDLILPGPELETKPIDRDAPMIVRIKQAIPYGTDAHRYQIEYYCLEAGEYNLVDYLQQLDGTPAQVPEVKVTVDAQLGEGQVLPTELTVKPTPRIGGYSMWLVIAGIVWVVGLIAILFVGRKQERLAKLADRPPSLADRLRPLVEQAMQGELSGSQQAELERMLLTYWRGKLGLNDSDASQAIIELRAHETAGQLLRQLEGWLHMPADRREEVNLTELLEPYRDVRDLKFATESTGVAP